MSDWRPSEFRARGLSTRAVQIIGDAHSTRLTREALEGAAQQVRDGFVPMTMEHLGYIPPFGRWHDAEVQQADDGEYELELIGKMLPQFVPDGGDPPDPLELIAQLPEQEVPTGVETGVGFETRNFEPGDLGDIQTDPPFPVHAEHRWAELPPIVWTLSIPVVWGACKFAGAFFESLGKESAEGVARWVRAAWNRAREPERDRMLAVQFELPDGSLLYGFVPSRYDDPHGDAVLAAALRATGLLAAFAGLQNERPVFEGLRRAAFIFDGTSWHLAWWTNGEAVYRTHWFNSHMPDPARYLGRPLLGD